ncbi:hypothetical protein ASG89_01755 [Paenibacillus sp. Soil766]|uniref:hypothetical protein n=1 Tax=Paenibacillus sp. Soil766 TaxID=1736404 RepID=UPI00070D97DC|nr:hypothetical protein [Paenibacillus sp. Soil766]KRF10282.1 hypothetical protein ASG89_01755 [Paenibacillus sp. Soil766]
MIKNKRSPITVAAVSVISLSLAIAGCSTNDSNSGSSPDASASTTTPKKKGNISVAVHDRSNVPPEQGTIDKNWATDWINANGPVNVKFVPIPRSSDTSKYNTLFAAGDVPDIVWSYDSEFKGRLINQQEVMALDEAIEKYSKPYKQLLASNPGLKKLTTHSDGHIYQIGRINGLQPNHALFIRTDWLQKLNLQIPQTTDELLQVAKAFATQDPDGNGKQDTYGIALSGISGNQIDYMFGNIGNVSKDGKLVNDWERKEAALAFKKQAFDAGIVDKDFLNDKDGSKAKQAWVTGKLGFYADNISIFGGVQTFTTLKQNNPAAQVAVIPLPKSKFGQFSGAIIPPIQVVGVVNADAKDPQAVVQYIDFLSEKSTMVKLAYGDINAEHTLTKDGYPQLKELNNPKFSWTGDLNILMSTINFGSQAAYLNSLKPEANPVDKEWIALYKQAQQAYLSADRPWPGVTWNEFLPALPNDLQTINSNTSQMGDFFSKAIVSGTSYSVDKAIKDARDLWDKAGGRDIDTWWGKWYDENKDKVYLTKDLYSK